jgi:hypothetical protein
MEVTLPGGRPLNGGLERRARFRPLTGRIEQALIEFRANLDRPGYVTAVLAAALERIGTQAADAGCITDLCVADRQYLMVRLAALLEGEQMWLKVGCGHCQALFDVDVRRCDLPVKPAGAGFPQATLRINGRTIEVRVPTGADQGLIGKRPETEALQQLLQRCIRAVNGEPPGEDFIDKLSEADIAAIDEALDHASPAVCSQLLVTCPECGREQSAELDHYALGGLNDHDFYDEVHTLASHYHWSEAAILDLPQARRRRYLGLISRSAGMTS